MEVSSMTINDSSNTSNSKSTDRYEPEVTNDKKYGESDSYDELVGLAGGVSNGNGEALTSDRTDMTRLEEHSLRSSNGSGNTKKNIIDKEKKRIYVQKYSTGVPLSEAVIVGGYPFFLQPKNGEPLLVDKIESNNLVIYPPDTQSLLSEPYVFESKEEIIHYLDLARKLSSFDQIFSLVKSIYKKYVDAEEHYIVLLAADTIYSYFQDKFATTHYVICIGDNSSGKNSILMTFKYLGYRVLLATGVSPANIYTFLGNVEECQGTIAEDEINNLENEPEKLNVYKSGYSNSSGRIPKVDLHSGRVQEIYLTYCFKIFATEKSLDNSLAKGLLDRSFEIQCIAGNPQYNIKEVFDKANEEKHRKLRLELQKTRKLLLAYRILHYEDTISDVKLNIINREAELTKPLIRLFRNSPQVLAELLPALSKLLNAKRKVKSNSLEAKLYVAVMNIIPYDSYVIDHQSLINEVMRITNGEDIVGQQAFYSTDLGKVTHRRIIRTLIDKFKAERTHKDSGSDKKRALEFKEENLRKKGREYNVPEKVEILTDEPSQLDSDKLDSFDALFVDSSSGGTEGTEGTKYRDKHKGTDAVTSIISAKQWTKFLEVFQDIIQNKINSNKNPNCYGLEKPTRMP
jgi:hypothetical protein